jgi:TolA-binding protein
MTSSIDSLRPDGAGTGARTPSGNAQASLSGLNTSELSPPGSQTQHAPGASPVEIRTALEARAEQSTDKNGEPTIAAWKSKRAQEDYQRAMEFVVDKDFKLGM